MPKMEPKTIAILGITGIQGSSVAEVFLRESGWKLRGVTRDPSKASAKAFAARGVEIVRGDFDDIESMTKALKGVQVIFGTTDFTQFMNDPTMQEKAKVQGRNLNELATERETEQGKKLIDAIATDVEALELFICSTFADSKGLSKGKYTYNLHFDAKWAEVDYLKSSYPSVWNKTSLLFMGLYMGNWNLPFFSPQKQKDGTYKFRLPIDGDFTMPLVEPNTDTGSFVKALTQLPPQSRLLGVSQMVTWDEYAQACSQASGVQIAFEKCPPEELEALMGSFGREFADTFKFVQEFGYLGGDNAVLKPWDLTPKVERTPLKKYLDAQNWPQILKP